jgi:outer membrane protein OmpA-like peptidoglycan-associated protein
VGDVVKYIITILLLSSLFISTAHSRNCAQAVHNKHCSSSSGNSASQSQTTTATGAAGQTPDPAQTNSHLGTGPQTTHPIVQVDPIVTHQIVGQTQAPVKPIMKIPPVVKYPEPPIKYTYNVPKPPLANNPIPPLQVYMVPSKVITGASAVPQQPITIAPPQTFTSPPQQQLFPDPGKVISGQSAVPPQPISLVPPKTFTSPPQQQVYPDPALVITGQSAVPPQQVYPDPGKVITGQSVVPPQQVYPDPGKVITGQSAVPPLQVYPGPGKVVTGQSAVPILIGQSAVPAQPGVNAPPKSKTATPSPQKLTPQLTPVIISHVASTNLHPDILTQQQMLHGGADLKSLEPHIKNLPVDVYTDKAVRKTTYGKSTASGNKGFNLTVVGVKEATFIDATPLPVAANSDDIVFNFSFASAEIHKDQLAQVDKIIAKHSKNGKRIILMGETDGFGNETYNKHLAVLRANKIIDELKARGAKVDDVEIRILVRCCRKDHPTKESLAETVAQRITWVHFQ